MIVELETEFVPDNPLRNACMLLGGLLAFSAISPILFYFLLGLPGEILVCSLIQLSIAIFVFAFGWFRMSDRSMWVGLVVSVALLIPNWCVAIFAILWMAN